MYEQFYYDAVEERIRFVVAGKEGEHDVFMDRLLLFREVKRTIGSQNTWSTSVSELLDYVLDSGGNKYLIPY